MPVPTPKYRFSDPILGEIYNKSLSMLKLSIAQAVLQEHRVPGFSERVRPSDAKPACLVADVVADRFRSFDSRRQKTAVRGVQSQLRSEPILLRTKTLSRLDLASERPVILQVDLQREFQFASSWMPKRESRADRADDWYPPGGRREPVESAGSAGVPGTTLSTNREVHFEVSRVECIDETGGGFWGSREATTLPWER